MVLLRFEPRGRPSRNVDHGPSHELSWSDQHQTSFSVLLNARDRELLDRGVAVLSFERLRRLVR